MKMCFVLSLAAVVSACSSHELSEPARSPEAKVASAEPAHDGGGSVSSQLLHDVQSSPQLYDIRGNGGDGLGHYALRFDGKPVWPPHGARCMELVRCCQQLATVADSLALTCLLATARDQNCRLARKTTTQIATEQGHQLPAACSQ